MAVEKPMLNIPDEVMESLARTILPSIQKYFESEEGQREFAAWKEEKEKEKVNIEHIINPK